MSRIPMRHCVAEGKLENDARPLPLIFQIILLLDEAGTICSAARSRKSRKSSRPTSVRGQ